MIERCKGEGNREIEKKRLDFRKQYSVSIYRLNVSFEMQS